ncbi:FUSC family protein [Novosphingobium album (ex Hu et al. 2023)]|uniref:FUSC family protein n=1 Tax=Novosphingobium album (ex Hu et al. 2023) TaxID=2930093 RepID=A0ABT0AVX7_9SPHN|nr:FUSC family protein [Novosphingobium album (ex Hu et al. 2023)]MCJ2176962.1 FUSC family protein [Novosphingobium album (ex Hu et al. 2023)]
MTSARWQAALFSAKTALAALMALWITLWAGLSMPFWAMTTTYIVANPLSGATRSKAIYRVIGTLAGAAIAVGLVPALVDWPLLLCLALSLWVGGTLAVSLLDRSPRSYTMMLAGYTALLIGFPAVDRPEAVFDIAVARVTEIVLGITCATLTHSLLWPQPVATTLGARLNAWLRDARAWRDDILEGAGAGAGRNRLAQDAMECVVLATHVPFDTSHWRDASASVQALLRRMLLLLPTLSGLADRHRALVRHTGSNAGGQDDWGRLLQQSHEFRTQQTAQLLDECGTLLAHLDDRSVPTPLSPEERRHGIALHADAGAALLSGLAAAIAILVCCAIWIGTGWADGAVSAMMTGVFCCLFAAHDNPVPMMLRFGGALLAALPVAGFYLFVLMPLVDGFVPLALLLLPPLLLAGAIIPHPHWGMTGAAAMMGFANALALQESFHANFARFINANIGQVLGLLVAAGVTAGLRTAGADAAIARVKVRLRADLVRLASAATPPGRTAVLGRTTDRLALITQRLGDATEEAAASLREVRIAMNIVTIQHLQAQAERKLSHALRRVLRDVARLYGGKHEALPPPRLLARIDVALRLMVADPSRWERLSGEILGGNPAEGLAALVALRRNLYPDAPGFSCGDRP